MTYKMMCTIPTIYLNGGVKIEKKGQIFNIEDKVTRDILIENKNAIDITDGMPATQQTDKDILLIQLQNKDAEINKLAKRLSELRQILKNAGLDTSDEPEEIEKDSKKKGGK